MEITEEMRGNDSALALILNELDKFLANMEKPQEQGNKEKLKAYRNRIVNASSRDLSRGTREEARDYNRCILELLN